ncbi:MAG TPA: hypothetical protein VES42_21705, partial [Pilimelia sp.]|nr:hypothetical protein [Pilimelia sp.]
GANGRPAGAPTGAGARPERRPVLEDVTATAPLPRISAAERAAGVAAGLEETAVLRRIEPADRDATGDAARRGDGRMNGVVDGAGR